MFQRKPTAPNRVLGETVVDDARRRAERAARILHPGDLPRRLRSLHPRHPSAHATGHGAHAACSTAAVGMLLAIVGTLLHAADRRRTLDPRRPRRSAPRSATRSGKRVAMTSMPQLIAISHTFGAVAVTLVGVAEYWTLRHGADVSRPTMAALGFEALLGGAHGDRQLHGLRQAAGVPARPADHVQRAERRSNFTLFGATFVLLALARLAARRSPRCSTR